MDYRRLEGESEEDLILRIASLKGEEGLETWSKVAEVINSILGVHKDESTYRKQIKRISSPAPLAEIDPIKVERVKLQTLNLERNKVDRTRIRQELYYEYVGKVVEALPVPEFQPVYMTEETEEEYVLTIADLHAGAFFTSENNCYSFDELTARMEYLAGYVEDFVVKHGVPTISIVCLGDCIQNILRLKDLRLLESPVVQSVVEVSRLIAQFLSSISTCVNVKYYHVPCANHSQIRYLNCKAGELNEEDLEYVIGNYIMDLCALNPRVDVYLAEEGRQYLEIPVTGSTVYAMHGHQIKNLDTAIKNLNSLTHNYIDYLLLGHYHGASMISSGESVCSDVEVIVAPSIVGSDPYSDSLFKGSKAAAQILGFDSLYGHNETYKIILN